MMMTGGPQALLAQLAQHYDLTFTSAERLGGEVDVNVRLLDEQGTPWFLKATADLEATREHWQWQVIDHVSRVDPDLPVPRIRRSRNGSLAVRLAYDGLDVEAAVMSWLPGQAMGRADGVDASTREDLGRRAAQLSRALQSMDPTGVPHTHHWDVRAFAPALSAGLDAVTAPQDRSAVLAIIDRCGHRVERLNNLPLALAHQDLNDFNVLVAAHDDDGMRVSGIIDFGDTILGLRVSEVVVAAAYAMLRQDDPVSALVDVTRGFTRSQPLTAAELAAVYPLAALRLCVNGCTWTARTATDPSEYGLSRMAFTWPVIRALAQVDPDEVQDRLLRSDAIISEEP